jgi:hypothetical protein
MVKYLMEKHGRNGFSESSVTGLEALVFFYIKVSGCFVVFEF